MKIFKKIIYIIMKLLTSNLLNLPFSSYCHSLYNSIENSPHSFLLSLYSLTLSHSLTTLILYLKYSIVNLPERNTACVIPNTHLWLWLNGFVTPCIDHLTPLLWPHFSVYDYCSDHIPDVQKKEIFFFLLEIWFWKIETISFIQISIV